jgi:pimeloyl-ACP methyl ester carboxylesterase
VAPVRAGEVELDCVRSGSGPPLLLIMGLSGTYLHWGEPFLGRLRKDFELIAYDHRGVGASTRLEGPITISEMAEDAANLLGALAVDSAHVLGISMGGMVAQELALHRPELVRTLTLGCTYCGGQGSALMGRESARRLADSRAAGDRLRAIRTSWEINVSASFAGDEAAWERFLQVGLQRPVALAVIRRHMAAIERHDTSARLGRLTMPTQVVHGTDDEVLPVRNGRLVASLIPGARLEILQGVGHMYWWERPERAAELVRLNAGTPVGR